MKILIRLIIIGLALIAVYQIFHRSKPITSEPAKIERLNPEKKTPTQNWQAEDGKDKG